MEAAYLRLFEEAGKSFGLLRSGSEMVLSCLPLTASGRGDTGDCLRKAEDRPKRYRSSCGY